MHFSKYQFLGKNKNKRDYNNDLVQHDYWFYQNKANTMKYCATRQQTKVYTTQASYNIHRISKMNQLAKTYWQTFYISSQ